MKIQWITKDDSLGAVTIYENNIRMNKYSSNQKIIIFILLIIIFIVSSLSKMVICTRPLKEELTKASDIERTDPLSVTFSNAPIVSALVAISFPFMLSMWIL